MFIVFRLFTLLRVARQILFKWFLGSTGPTVISLGFHKKSLVHCEGFSGAASNFCLFPQRSKTLWEPGAQLATCHISIFVTPQKRYTAAPSRASVEGDASPHSISILTNSSVCAQICRVHKRKKCQHLFFAPRGAAPTFSPLPSVECTPGGVCWVAQVIHITMHDGVCCNQRH